MIVMSWILMVVVATLLVVLLRARRAVSRLPHTFPCKLAMSPRGSCSDRWPRRTARAMWEHDVLIVFRGLTRTRVRAYGVHFAEGGVTSLAQPVRGLGPAPVVLSLQLDDGTHALLAAPGTAHAYVAGPFLASLAWSDVAESRGHSGGPRSGTPES